MKEQDYKQGLYEYDGIGTHRVVLHIGERWYLAGWEVPLTLSDTSSCSRIDRGCIGKLLYELTPEEDV